jgi:hypothetical protein
MISECPRVAEPVPQLSLSAGPLGSNSSSLETVVEVPGLWEQDIWVLESRHGSLRPRTHCGDHLTAILRGKDKAGNTIVPAVRLVQYAQGRTQLRASIHDAGDYQLQVRHKKIRIQRFPPSTLQSPDVRLRPHRSRSWCPTSSRNVQALLRAIPWTSG